MGALLEPLEAETFNGNLGNLNTHLFHSWTTRSGSGVPWMLRIGCKILVESF